jgi:hypothetical protein
MGRRSHVPAHRSGPIVLRVQDHTFSSFFLSSGSPGPPLRIGVLLGDVRLDHASASILEDIRASDFARLQMVVFDGSGQASEGGSKRHPFRWSQALRLARDPSWRGGLAWRLYVRLDRRRVQVPNDPLAEEDCSAALEGIDAIRIRPIWSGEEGRVPADDLARLRAADLDVIICLGAAEPRDEVLDAARYGVWALCHGDPARYRGGPPGFWEMVEGDPVTGAALERFGPEPGASFVLAKAWFATDMGSLARNRVQPSFGSTYMVIQKLRELHQWGWAYVVEHSEPSAAPPWQGRVRRRPTNLEVLRWLGPRTLGAVIRRLIRAVTARDEVEQWQMAVRMDGHGLAVDGSVDMSGFRWVKAPKGRFFADPFVIERDGRTWLFFEDYRYAEGRGVISCAELSADGRLVAPEVVIASNGHLSYPYVFFDGSEAYMIPETAAEGSVRLYRATDFPRGWEPLVELYAGPAVDTSVWQQDGRWWFFTTLREPRSQAAMLWLFHAEAPTGPWVPHPMNPISADVRNARGGGSIFGRDGRVIRPSQDGSRGYGHSFSLNEIVTLSTTDYAERPIVTVGPDWDRGLLGTHTYNRSGSVEVTDGKARRARRQVV